LICHIFRVLITQHLNIYYSHVSVGGLLAPKYHWLIPYSVIYRSNPLPQLTGTRERQINDQRRLIKTRLSINNGLIELGASSDTCCQLIKQPVTASVVTNYRQWPKPRQHINANHSGPIRQSGVVRSSANLTCLSIISSSRHKKQQHQSSSLPYVVWYYVQSEFWPGSDGKYVLVNLSLHIAYCAIFSAMSSAVVDLHICICMRVSSYSYWWLYLCAAPLRLSHAARRVAAEPTQFSGRVDLFHLLLPYNQKSRDRHCVSN